MKIVVLLKQVPDTESVIELSDTGTAIDPAEVKWVVNPYDEYSLEEALQIRERRGDVTVTALTAGNSEADQVIRTAFALGVDEGIRIDTTRLTSLDPLSSAAILAAALRDIGADLILAGLRAVDDDHYQVPAMLAEMLELPLVAGVLEEEINADVITCKTMLDSGFARVESGLPAVLTTQKGINEPRYPNIRALMKARKQPVTVRTLAEIGLDAGQFVPENLRLQVISLAYAPARGAGQVIEGATAAEKAETLIRLLQEHTDVI
jgi:electron transfer flavoprotein beta subunit